MPFDGAPWEPPHIPPRKPDRAETAFVLLLAALALLLLVLPISFAATADLAAYLVGRR